MYQPAKEFINSFKEGQIVKPLEFAKSFTPEMTEDSKAKQLCLFHEIAEKELIRFNAFEFYKPLTSEELEFIKKANEDYNEFRGTDYVCYAYYVDRWIEYIPDNCFFKVDDVSYYIPGPKPADSTIKNYLNKAANEGKLLKYSTDNGRYYFKVSKHVEETPKVVEKDYNEIQKLFINFLKKRKAFDGFKENLKKASRFNSSDDPTRSMLTMGICPTGWIKGTIIWYKTPEGFGFWENIHYDWCVTLIKHFRPKLGATLEQLIDPKNDMRVYFTHSLVDVANDILFTEGWDLTKCTSLV